MVLSHELLVQWQRILSPKIDPNVFGNLVHSKYDIQIYGENMKDSINVIRTIG